MTLPSMVMLLQYLRLFDFFGVLQDNRHDHRCLSFLGSLHHQLVPMLCHGAKVERELISNRVIKQENTDSYRKSAKSKRIPHLGSGRVCARSFLLQILHSNRPEAPQNYSDSFCFGLVAFNCRFGKSEQSSSFIIFMT